MLSPTRSWGPPRSDSGRIWVRSTKPACQEFSLFELQSRAVRSLATSSRRAFQASGRLIFLNGPNCRLDLQDRPIYDAGMNRYAQQKPPRWWPPKLSRFWIRVWRPLRKRTQYREQQLMEVEVHGRERLRQAVDAGSGIMITPNHSGHADAYIMYHASDELNTPFYFITAWQVFHQARWLVQRILQHHGCFSVDREGTDMKAFRKATEVLQQSPYSLVIFPEGEVYRINERITPFRDGDATIALSAAKRAERPGGVRPLRDQIPSTWTTRWTTCWT